MMKKVFKSVEHREDRTTLRTFFRILTILILVIAGILIIENGATAHARTEQIIIGLQTDPDGSEQIFTFQLIFEEGGSCAFSLVDGQSRIFPILDTCPTPPGTYQVVQVIPAGWIQTSATCDRGNDPSEIILHTDETVTCIFENMIQRGNIIVEKQTKPKGSSEKFTFSTNYKATFMLGDGEYDDSGPMLPTPEEPILYSVVEDWNLMDGWFEPEVICVGDGNRTVADNTEIDLQPDETVICTFTNTEPRGAVELLKLTNGVEDLEMEWNFTLTGHGVDESDISPPPLVNFDAIRLIPDETYTLCETGIPAGWSLVWKGDTPPGDGIPDAVIPIVYGDNSDTADETLGYSRLFNPNFLPPPADFPNNELCVNFTAKLGETMVFSIDNQYPGGEPQPIGFWKNWNTCSTGNQADTALNNGGPDAGWYILDDLLTDPGYTIGTLTFGYSDCESTVSLLDKRTIDNLAKKKANDAAYKLAAQLLAAQLNLSVGSENCEAVQDAIVDALVLLESIGFDGIKKFLEKKGTSDDTNYQLAIDLAFTLDQYNNGVLCNP